MSDATSNFGGLEIPTRPMYLGGVASESGELTLPMLTFRFSINFEASEPMLAHVSLVRAAAVCSPERRLTLDARASAVVLCRCDKDGILCRLRIIYRIRPLRDRFHARFEVAVS